MITCADCGKINGHGQQGNSWICEDCREGEAPAAAKSSEQLEKPVGKPQGQ